MGASLVIESRGHGCDVGALLTDSTGRSIPITRDDASTFEMTIKNEFWSAREVFTPETPLEPGDYVLEPRLGYRDTQRIQPKARFTVLPELPPETTPPMPTLNWNAYAARSQGERTLGPTWGYPGHDLCEGSPRVVALGPDPVWLDLSADVESSDAQGHLMLEFVGADGEVFGRLASPVGSPPEVGIDRGFAPLLPFVQCVTVTFVDMYGRPSEPTTSCAPDKCSAATSWGRVDVDWDDVSGCDDWSPGYAERNASGCGCAQLPNTQTPAPLALLALALGALLLRPPRRRIS